MTLILTLATAGPLRRDTQREFMRDLSCPKLHSRMWNRFCLLISHESVHPHQPLGLFLSPVDKEPGMATHIERILELIWIFVSSLINTIQSLLRLLYEFVKERLTKIQPSSNGAVIILTRLISMRAILIAGAVVAIVFPSYARIKTWYSSYRPPVAKWPVRHLQGKIVGIDVVYQDDAKRLIAPDKSSVRFVNSIFGTTNTFHALTLNDKRELKVFAHEWTSADLGRIDRFYKNLSRTPSSWENFTLESKIDPRRPLPDQGAYPFAIERSSYTE